MNHTSVLLLDTSWRVDRVISVQRACELVLDGVVVDASPELATIMRSPSIEVPIPSVIARIDGYIVADRYSRAACSLRNVRLRDRHECQFVRGGEACTRTADSVDHLVPRARGGRSTWTNLVAACRRCNGTKRDLPLSELGWALRRAPYAPTRRELLTSRLATAARPEWEQFLAA